FTGTSTNITGSPTSSVNVTVPADTSLCDVRTLTKTAVGYDTGTDTATWSISVANTGANAISRNVTITDSGVSIVGATPAACTSGTLATGLNCTVAAGTTLSFQVSKVVAQQCQAATASNSASAVF